MSFYYRGPTSSINFISAHDGFTLADLVMYSAKRNEANQEDNRDGSHENRSWNLGHEGPTDDPVINAHRHSSEEINHDNSDVICRRSHDHYGR
jgi:isoamylase